MRSLWVALVLAFLPASAFSEASQTNCANLSHVREIPPYAPFEWVQVGCEGFDIYQVVDGNRFYHSRNLVTPEWQTTDIDDEYEIRRGKYRWFWSNDRQKLLFEQSVETLQKDSGLTSFQAESSAFALVSDDPKQIVETGARIVRLQTADGQVTTTTTQISNHHARILEQSTPR